jgi:hypothetical protein
LISAFTGMGANLVINGQTKPAFSQSFNSGFAVPMGEI